VNVVEHDVRVEALGMLEEALHQLRALHAGMIGRPVVDFRGGHELSTLCDPGDQHGAQVGARGVHGGGVAGRARAEDQQVRVSSLDCHGAPSQSLSVEQRIYRYRALLSSRL
jgi:hypothetical protein